MMNFILKKFIVDLYSIRKVNRLVSFLLEKFIALDFYNRKFIFDISCTRKV